MKKLALATANHRRSQCEATSEQGVSARLGNGDVSARLGNRDSTVYRDIFQLMYFAVAGLVVAKIKAECHRVPICQLHPCSVYSEEIKT